MKTGEYWYDVQAMQLATLVRDIIASWDITAVAKLSELLDEITKFTAEDDRTRQNLIRLYHQLLTSIRCTVGVPELLTRACHAYESELRARDAIRLLTHPAQLLLTQYAGSFEQAVREKKRKSDRGMSGHAIRLESKTPPASGTRTSTGASVLTFAPRVASA